MFRRWLVLLVLAVLALMPSFATAQISPGDMFSGVDSVDIINFAATKTFFTVPSGQQFVLTDFACGSPELLSCRIYDNESLLRWFVPSHKSGDGINANREYGTSWQTGLRFDAGHTVNVEVRTSGSSAPPIVYFTWSGYLSPGGISAVPLEDRAPQVGFRLSPNPSSQVVTLRFELNRPADVTLRIFDVQGRQVSTVASGRMSAGIHVRKWDGKTRGGGLAASGVYFARLESSQAKSVRRFVRLR
jgi:flagellar hook capping protein FlgD